MGTRSEMDDAVNTVLAQRAINIGDTAHVPFDEMEVGEVSNGTEVVHGCAVPEVVEAYDHISVPIDLDQATNEPSPAGKACSCQKKRRYNLNLARGSGSGGCSLT